MEKSPLSFLSKIFALIFGLFLSSQLFGQNLYNSSINHLPVNRSDENALLQYSSVPSQNIQKRINAFDFSIEEEQPKAFHINFACNTWYAKWSSFNYISEKTISPTWLVEPSVTFIIKDFHFTLSGSTSINVGVSAQVNLPANEISRESSKGGIEAIKYRNKKPLFRSELWFGKFSGEGVWDYLEDTINFNRVIEKFDVKGNAFSFDLFPGEGLGWGYLATSIGLRFVSYNTPAFLRGEDIPDPRNPNNILAFIDIPDTRINHIFFILDAGKLMKPLFGIIEKPEQKEKEKLQLKWKGHFYYLLMGFGWGNNEPMGNISTFSAMSATSVIDGHIVFSMDMDFGPALEYDMGNGRKISTMLGVKWVDWEIISGKKNKMQVRSKERFWGPYLNASITL